MLSTDGRVRSLGGAFDLGDPLRAGAAAGVAIAAAQDADSYWVVANDGAVFTFGNARNLGTLPDQGVRTKVADMAGRSDGNGYWILGEDGTVYPFGTAAALGGLPQIGVATTARKVRPTPTGNGYWILGSDGGIFSFGDAAFFGSVPGVGATTAAVDMTSTPSGQGYWVLGEDGGVFSFGDAHFFGSVPGLKINWARPGPGDHGRVRRRRVSRDGERRRRVLLRERAVLRQPRRLRPPPRRHRPRHPALTRSRSRALARQPPLDGRCRTSSPCDAYGKEKWCCERPYRAAHAPLVPG